MHNEYQKFLGDIAKKKHVHKLTDKFEFSKFITNQLYQANNFESTTLNTAMQNELAFKFVMFIIFILKNNPDFN